MVVLYQFYFHSKLILHMNEKPLHHPNQIDMKFAMEILLFQHPVPQQSYLQFQIYMLLMGFSLMLMALELNKRKKEMSD